MTGAEQHERRALTKADQHIADGEKLFTEQIVLIARLGSEQRDTTLAEELLASLEAVLAQHCEHRRLILQRIAQFERTRAYDQPDAVSSAALPGAGAPPRACSRIA